MSFQLIFAHRCRFHQDERGNASTQAVLLLVLAALSLVFFRASTGRNVIGQLNTGIDQVMGPDSGSPDPNSSDDQLEWSNPAPHVNSPSEPAATNNPKGKGSNKKASNQGDSSNRGDGDKSTETEDEDNDKSKSPDEPFSVRLVKSAKQDAKRGATDWKASGTHKHARDGANKCNLFVYDKLKESGLDIGLRERNTWRCQLGLSTDDLCNTPPTTTEWRDPTTRPSEFEVVPLKDARPGDIHLIDRGPNRSGHIGIVSGRNENGQITTISALADKVSEKVPTVHPSETVVILRPRISR